MSPAVASPPAAGDTTPSDTAAAEERKALVDELRSLVELVDAIGSEVAGALDRTAGKAAARARGGAR